MSCKEPTTAMIDDLSIESNKTEVILRIKIDQELKCDEHGNCLFKKGGQKLNAIAIARIAPFMNINKKINNIKGFIESQFGYCLLIWMFYSRGLNNKISRIDEKGLRTTFNDKPSSFSELLNKDNCATIYNRNVKPLAIETSKVIRGLSLSLLNVPVPCQCIYDLRGNIFPEKRRVKSVRYGTVSIVSSSKNMGNFTK